MNKYSLSIIVPVYNEIQLIQPFLERIDPFIRSHFENYEIIIIESGSTDGSGQAVDELAIKFPQIKIIHEGARNGFGSALKLGYKNSTKDLVWLITADLPFPLESILGALPLLDQYDCILSYRISDDRGYYRKLQSLIYNFIMRSLLNLKVKHVNSAFKLFKRPVVQSLPLVSNGWFLDTEILYWLRKNNIKTTEIPVPLIERTCGKSTISPLTPFFMLWEAVKFIRKQAMTAKISK